MKLKFLDVHNCHALLPHVHGFSMIRVLDEYLQQEFNNRDKQHELIDALIRQNKRTRNMSRGSLRLCNSPIEIALNFNAVSQEIDFRSIIKPWSAPALLHVILVYENGMTWKTVVPLQFLLKEWGDATNGHQCYVHSISQSINQLKSFAEILAHESDSSYHYVGITGRNWLLRFREHMREMRRSSRKKFHIAVRESLGLTDIHYISQLGDINLTYEDAMNWEELHVDQLGSHSLNMIPGGFKGLKHLHEHRIIDRIDISLEERDKAIAEYVRRNPRKGIPNPFIAELWKDDEYYLKIIEARPKTLSPSQVRKIRELARIGRSVTEIAEEIDALNEVQVKNVLADRTYRRIH